MKPTVEKGDKDSMDVDKVSIDVDKVVDDMPEDVEGKLRETQQQIQVYKCKITT